MRAVLWDLDGTLIDSAAYHWRSWLETMRGEGIEVTFEQFRASFGMRNDTILAAWLGPAADPGRIARLGDAKEVAYRRLMRAGGLEPLPGCRAWVDRLAREGWKQAIASSAPRLNVEAVLDVLGWHRIFDAVAAAEDVRTGKPDPEVFLVAAARAGVPPARCVVVEDAAAGIEAARRAGMRSIAVGEVAHAGADVAVTTLADLPADAFVRLIAGEGVEPTAT
jgi:beta-phosphoglucomutase